MPAARGFKIAGAVLAMAALIIVVGETLRSGDEDGMRAPDYRAPAHDGGILAVVRADGAMAAADPQSASLAPLMQPAAGVRLRSIATYYERRAYPGAPPAVPHVVDAETNRTQACNVCHEKGGFTPKFNAYVPVTPHPQYRNCLQCHAQGAIENPVADFVDHDWLSVRLPKLHRPALPGNPPPMAHPLRLHNNCLSCHSGPAAVAEVRTSHPERVNCQQCHVPRNTQGVFQRGGRAGG
jgi:nitrate reductase cytochrome c-type subunit